MNKTLKLPQLLLLILCMLQISAFGQRNSPLQLAPTNNSSANTRNQQQKGCGTDHHHEQMLLNNPSFQSIIDDNESKIAAFYNKPKKKAGTVYRIPIVFHVMETGNSLTNISDEQIQNSVRELNEFYRNSGSYVGNSLDMEVEFVLAVRDPNGNCTNGITRTDMTSYPAYMSAGVLSESSGMAELSLKNIIRWNPSQYYNVWAVSEIDNNNGGAGTQGYAYFASSHGSNLDGTIVLVNCLKQSGNTTMIHELGHAFNLYHTFQGDNNGASCPTNANCTTDGDMVCDTPPHKRSASNCIIGANTCDNNTSTTLYVYNIMDYSSCANMFTAGQKARFQAALQVVRTSFLEANGNMSLVPVSIAGVDFKASTALVCSPSAVKLTDLSSCIANNYLDTSLIANLTFAWTVTNGTQTYTSSLRNPSFASLPAGTYNVTLSVTNILGTNSMTKQGLFVVGNGATNACSPSNTNSNNYGLTVENVKFNTINHYTDKYLNQGYQNFVCTQSTIVQAGATYPLTLTINALSSGDVNYEVYIDYNNDGIFSNPSELITSGVQLLNSNQLVIQNVTIPSNAVTNQLLRMRVMTEFGTITANKRNCLSSFYVGDIEDYGIYISNNVASATLAVSPSNNISFGSSVTFTATPTNGGTAPTYQWFKNNQLIAGVSTATYTTNTLQDGDVIYAIMTSNLAGVVASPSTTNSIIMQVYGPPVSNFAAANNSTCSNSAISFTDLSTFVPSAWSWSFPGATPATSTAQNPTVTYSTPGTYDVTLTTSNAHGQGSTETKTAYIQIYPSPAQICNNFVSTINLGYAGIGISNVSLNTINNTTVTTDNIYNNYTCTKLTNLQIGTPYPISIQGSSSNQQWYRVYIDLNGNNVFDLPGELVFSKIGIGSVQDTIIIPSNALTNSLIRMRVISDFINTNGSAGPCMTNLQYGQVEDYGVIIKPAPCVLPIITAQPSAQTVCVNAATTFTTSATGNSLTYQWQTSTNGGSSWSNITAGPSYSGFTTNSLVISAALANMNNRLFRCKISNSCDSVFTNNAALQVSAPSAPVITASGTTNFCQGGSVVLTSSVATGNLWSNGATTQSITVSTAGSYTVTNTQNGCTSPASAATAITVNAIPSSPTIAAAGPLSFCQGGSVVLTSSATTGNTWSNGATTQSITVSTAGSYTVTTAQNGCTSAASLPTVVVVNAAPTAPSITASGSTTFCQGGNVVLTSSVATGNLWSNGATTQSITVSTAGSYSVTNTQNGCTSPASAATVITVNAIPSAPTIAAAGAISFCQGGNVVLTSSATTGNTWSNGATTQSITVSTAGSYTVTNTQNACVSPSSSPTNVVVNAIPTAPTITASGATTICQGGNVVLTSSAATGNIWSNGATTQSITVSTAGTYTVANTQNGCTSPQSNPTVVTVTSIPAPTVTASGSLQFCNGGNVVLTSSSATGNLWSNGATTQSITISTAGSYTVTNTQNGCTSPASAATAIIVSAIPSTPTIAAAGPLSFCQGGSVVLTSSATTGNTWSNGATTQSITVSTAGSYTVTTAQNGCTSAASLPTVVVVNAAPTAPSITASGSTTFCQGGNVVLTSSSTTGNIWSNGATTQSITVSTAGSYTVSRTQNGCASPLSNPTIVTVNSLPVASVTANGPLQFCSGGNVVLTSSSTTGNTWSNGATTQSITVTNSGAYSVTVSQNGCTSAPSAQNIVTVTSAAVTPTITANGATTFCQGGSITLTSSSANSNLWSTGSTSSSITVNTSGTYTVTTSPNGCPSAPSAPIVVTVTPLPTPPTITASGPLTFCQGSDVVLTSSYATGNLWLNGATTQSITVNSSGTFAAFASQNGCQSMPSIAVVVTVTATPPTPTITANGPLTFCDGQNVVLTSSSPNGNVWSDGSTNQSITVSSSGSHSVNVTIAGCSSLSSSPSTVVVNPLPQVSLSAIGSMCEYNPALVLTNGLPAGGTYSGPGITGNSFDPSIGTGSHTITYTYTDNACTSSASTVIEVGACLGIDDLVAEEGINIYPNPSTGQFNIVGIENGNYDLVKVLDAAGRLIEVYSITSSQLNLNLAHLAGGTYSLQFTGSDRALTRRVVITE